MKKQKLGKWFTIAEMAIVRDALREFLRSSLHLQHRDTTLLTVGDHLEVVICALQSMKETQPTLQQVMDAVSQCTDNEAEADNNCKISRPRVITLETKARVIFPS